MYIYSTGNLHVPAALEQANKVTRSFDFLKFLTSLSPQHMRVLDGKSRYHNPVSSALNTWFRVYPSSSILRSSLLRKVKTAEASADRDSPWRDIPITPCLHENLCNQPEHI